MRRFLLFVAASFVAASFAAPASAREVVRFGGYEPGTIVVKTNERKLHLVVEPGVALRYPVGVGKRGHAWAGTARIDGKYIRPAWSPPDDIKRANPRIPDIIRGGAPNNPMGAAALTLTGGEYAIHGTNSPKSIGGFVSHGCIRMHNSDIMDLYSRVSVGTQVVLLK